MIEVRESSRSSAKFAKLTGPEAPVVALPAWLNRETGSLKGVVAKLPERSDIDYEVAEHLICLLYTSRSNNPINVVSATFAGLCGLVSAESVAEKRGKTVKEILG